MTDRRLTRDLVADTSLWTLAVRVAPDSLSALLVGPVSADCAVMSRIEPLADGSLKAREDASCDNSLLLGEFSRTTVVLATSQFTQIPDGISHHVAERIAEAMLPDCDAPRSVLPAPMPQGQLLAAVDSEILNFLKRTFPDAGFGVSLSALARGVAALPSGAARAFAFCYPGEVVVLTFDAEGILTFANRFDAFSAADCAYFILAAAAGERIPVSLGGNPDLRNDVMEQLRLAAPDLELTPIALPESLLAIRRQAPEISDDLIFLSR